MIEAHQAVEILIYLAEACKLIIPVVAIVGIVFSSKRFRNWFEAVIMDEEL